MENKYIYLYLSINMANIRKTMQEYNKYFLLGFISLLLIVAFWFFGSIITYILISYVLSLIGHPLVRLLQQIQILRFRIPKWMCAGITLSLLWMLFYTFFRIFVPLLASQADKFSQIDVQTILTNLEEPIKKIELFFVRHKLFHSENFSIPNLIADKILHYSNNLFFSLAGSLTTIIKKLFIAVLSISFITFFFLKDDQMFSNTILLLIPRQDESRVLHILSSIQKLLSRYFLGIIIEIICIIILETTGLRLAGLEFKDSLTIGLVMGVINVIPYVGPFIGACFGLLIGIVSIMHLDFHLGIMPLIGYMLIVFIAVKIIDDVFFQPYIYSSSVNAHPLEIFIIILMAANIGGIIGMVLAVPVYTVFRVIAKEFFSEYRLIQKMTKKIE